MSEAGKVPFVTTDHDVPFTGITRQTFSRRDFLAGSTIAGITLLLPGFVSAAPTGAKTFTILHTNDMHASFIGMGPSADYTPFTLNDDRPVAATRGWPA